MSAINNVTTSDGYTPAATLNCPPTRSLTVQVSNAAVYYQLLLSYGQPVTDPRGIAGPHSAYYNRPGDSLTGASVAGSTEEIMLLPGFWTFGENDFGDAWCVGIQLRSFASGNPAQVSASD